MQILCRYKTIPKKIQFFPLILIQFTKTDYTFEGKHQSHKNRKTMKPLTYSSVLWQKCHIILQYFQQYRHGDGERADWIDTGQESTKKVHYREKVSFLFKSNLFHLSFIIIPPPKKKTVFEKSYKLLFWRRQWHPTPVLLPGKSQGWRSLEGCSPWGR